MIIDGHTHIVLQDTQRYPLADPQAFYRPTTDGSAALLKEQMQAAGVDRALTITAGFYGWDNSSALDERKGNEDWLAVGLLVDPTGADAPAELSRLVEAGACGLRIQRHLFYHKDLDDPISTPLWQRAAELDLTVDINASHPEYASVEARVREFPQTRFVLDHCGYVSGELAPKENTTAPVTALARYPNVYAKLSFLPLASRKAFPFADVHWMVREIVDAFGPERCLFGSSFPTAQYSPQTSYVQAVELFSDAVELSKEERAWILGGTAAGLWRWGN
jgi:L-fuconolactonase